MNKKQLLIFTAVLIALMLISSVVYAEPTDLEGFIPDLKKLTGGSPIVPEYALYPWNSYTFDIEKGNGIIDISSVINIIPNIFFLPLVLLTKLSTVILISCYKVSIFKLIPDALNSIVLAIKTGIFEGFYETLVSLAGVYGMYLTYKGEKTSGFKIALTTIIIFGLSVLFFSNPSLLAENLNKASEIISGKVLQETFNATTGKTNKVTINSPDDAVVLMGNLFWNMAVKVPYELIEFGNVGKNDIDAILKLEVGSKEREELVNEHAKTNSFFRAQSIPARTALALIMFIIGLVYNICILAIAGAIVWCQIDALYLMCFAGVFFLASLYPKNGMRVLGNWALDTFGFLLKKVIITIALSIYFAISYAIYEMAGDYGYVTVIAFNIIILVLAIIKRKKIYEMLMGLFTADQGMVNRGMQKESFGSKLTKGVMTAYAAQRLYNGAKGTFERYRRNSFDKKNKDKAVDLLTQRYQNEKQQARKSAENTLMQRYQKEKEQAQKRATDTGREPEYSRFVMEADRRKESGLPMFSQKQINENLNESDFVKQVDDRRQKGYTLFSDDQVKAATNQMYKLKKEGNDPDRLFYTRVEGKDEDTIKDDQREKTEALKAVRNQLEEKRRQNNEKIEDIIEADPTVGPFKFRAYGKRILRRNVGLFSEVAREVTPDINMDSSGVAPVCRLGEVAVAGEAEEVQRVDNPVMIPEECRTPIERVEQVEIQNQEALLPEPYKVEYTKKGDGSREVYLITKQGIREVQGLISNTPEGKWELRQGGFDGPVVYTEETSEAMMEYFKNHYAEQPAEETNQVAEPVKMESKLVKPVETVSTIQENIQSKQVTGTNHLTVEENKIKEVKENSKTIEREDIKNINEIQRATKKKHTQNIRNIEHTESTEMIECTREDIGLREVAMTALFTTRNDGKNMQKQEEVKKLLRKVKETNQGDNNADTEKPS